MRMRTLGSLAVKLIGVVQEKWLARVKQLTAILLTRRYTCTRKVIKIRYNIPKAKMVMI